ncbi:MAG: YitT family protein [Candidatus Coproplasma sp.]
MKLKYKKGELKLINFLALLVAGVINAAGVTLLLAPVGLYDSGVSGLAMFLDMLIEVMPLWSWLIIINFPIFLFGMKKQGVAFTVYSLFAIAAYSLFSFLFQNVIPLFAPDFFANGSPIVGNTVVLCCVFGGVLSGIGSGITIRFGGAMDGMETLGVIFAKRLNLTVGNFVMVFNVILYIVIGITVVCTGRGDFSIPLYSIIAYFVNSKAVDFITLGLDQAKGALIITAEYDKVAPALSEEFGRGLTIIDGKGYYSQADKKVIYCVVNRFQLHRLRTVVSRCDKNAFVTIMDITDVFGTSIKNSRANEKKREEQLKRSRQIARTAAEKEAGGEIKEGVGEIAVSDTQAETSDITPANNPDATPVNNSDATPASSEENIK